MPSGGDTNCTVGREFSDDGEGTTPPTASNDMEAEARSTIISSTPNKSTQGQSSDTDMCTSDADSSLATELERESSVKIDLKRETDLRQRLQNQVELLESELDKYKKSDNAQKASIKKLTRENDHLKRELSKFTGMRKYVSDRIPEDSTTKSPNCEELLLAQAKIESLKSHIKDTANCLLTALSDDTDSGDVSRQSQSDIQNGEFTLVTSRHKNRSKAIQTTDTIPSTTDGRSTPTTCASRASPSPKEPSSASSYRNMLVNGTARPAPGPETLIIGTSLVRGISTHLSNRGINSTTYCYPGADIPRVGRRLETILTPRNKSAHVVLQLGGNDLEEHTPAEVVQQYDKLIHDVKRRCPRSTTVFVNRVPPRGYNGRIRQGINMVNTYLRNRGKRGDGVRYIDSCPHFPGQFKKDRLHFSKTGSRDYADKLACHLINFQVDTRKKRDWSMITIRPRAPQTYAKHP